MKEKNNKIGLYHLIVIAICFFLIYAYLMMRNQDTITVGIYTGSSWDVPGTEQYEMIDKAIDIFHEKYPNIKVTYEEGIPAEKYSEWLMQRFLQGRSPDVFLVLPEDFQNMVTKNALQGLNDKILQDDEFNKDVFYQSAYDSGNYKGVQYALPIRCNPTMMFVNQTLLKKEGIDMPDNDWTWNDFYSICKRVTKDTDGDGILDQFGYCGYSWKDAVYSNGTQPFADDLSKSNYTEDSFLAAMNYMRKLNALHGNYMVTSRDFDLGHVAFQPLNFAEYRTYMPYPWRIKKYSQFQWNCVSMPAGPSGSNTSYMDTVFVGMSNRCTSRLMAWEFMKILTLDERVQIQSYKHTAGTSVLRHLNRSAEVTRILNEDTPGDSEIDPTMIDKIINEAIVPVHFSGYEIAMQYVDSYMADILLNDEEMNIAMFRLKDELNRMAE